MDGIERLDLLQTVGDQAIFIPRHLPISISAYYNGIKARHGINEKLDSEDFLFQEACNVDPEAAETLASSSRLSRCPPASQMARRSPPRAHEGHGTSRENMGPWPVKTNMYEGENWR